MNGVSLVLLFSSLIIGALLIVALLKKEQSEWLKLFLFAGIVGAAAFATVYLTAYTIMENQRSATGGPVHWHADFEIYSCGQPVKLKNPSGLSNRIGTPLLHEHGDGRIHVEGTVGNLKDVALGKFFESLGGKLTNNLLLLPTDQGEFAMQNWQDCPGETTKPALQIFVYKIAGREIIQEKLLDLAGYILTPASKIPPGDCLIIEFGPPKAKTDKMCTFYKLAIQNGDYQYGD